MLIGETRVRGSCGILDGGWRSQVEEQLGACGDNLAIVIAALLESFAV